ncbi:MAG: sulfotransferase family 2 domain-containing protein [Rhodobacteraceae bacterium]|nr:sulfotransferase family 2 domain-containing protein [Paracoccaceae bacterium]
MLELDLRDEIGFATHPHYWFDAGGTRFGYCYIRKNGCTCFKKLICDTSPAGRPGTERGAEIQFMNAHHRIRSHAELERCARMILVTRDPYERLISAYLNKFVVRSGNRGIFKNFRRVMQEEPETASFRSFVTGYCREPARRDVHVQPQRAHLLPIRYDAVFPLGELFEGMAALVGPEIAGQYFRKPENPTAYGSEGTSAVDVPAEVLREAWVAGEGLPSRAALADEELGACVRESYDGDYRMLAALHAH